MSILTQAQRRALLHLASGDTGWMSAGTADVRWATARALARLGLVEIGDTRYYNELRSTAFGRDYYSQTIADNPVRLTAAGWAAAKQEGQR